MLMLMFICIWIHIFIFTPDFDYFVSPVDFDQYSMTKNMFHKTNYTNLIPHYKFAVNRLFYSMAPQQCLY